jgi:hypothetical protein
MGKTISEEINEWWNEFDLVEKILIKDTIINLCDKEISPAKKEKYIQAIRKRIKTNSNKTKLKKAKKSIKKLKY